MFTAISVNAQGIPVSGIGLDLTASTDNPVPGQKVTITARSYSVDINASTLTWSVNGKTVQKDVGLTTLEVTAPALGKKLTITVTAATPNKMSLANTIVVGSGSVDLIMENNGYIPPLFKGKTPVSYQNTIKIVAFPHLAGADGVEIDPKNLIYRWNKNSLVVEDQSGYGKQTFTLIGDIVPRAADIAVTATTRDGSMRATGYITVSYGAPALSFYIDDPLYGPFWNNAVSENVYIGSEKETSVLAVPYGFDKPVSGIGKLGLTWMINGYEHAELGSNQSVTLRAPSGTSGTSEVSLGIRNNQQILQSANQGFTARFSSNPNETAATTVNQ